MYPGNEYRTYLFHRGQRLVRQNRREAEFKYTETSFAYVETPRRLEFIR